MTVAQLQKLRVGMGHAIWGRKDIRNLSAALLLLKSGVGDPYVARVLRSPALGEAGVLRQVGNRRGAGILGDSRGPSQTH